MATVLVVEDDGDTRELLSRYLRFMGHRAIAASNGQDALSALASERADLILMDMMMPVMDGAAFLRAVRGSGQDAGPPVVVCTAMDRDRLGDALKHLNTTAVLRKTDGFFIDLVDIVSEQLRRTSAAQVALN